MSILGRAAKVVPLLLLLGAMGHCMCSNTVQDRLVAGNRENCVLIVTRDCGATTDYSTLVMLERPWWRGGDRVLVAYDGIVPIKVAWDTSKRLTLIEPPNARRFSKTLPDWLTVSFVVSKEPK